MHSRSGLGEGSNRVLTCNPTFSRFYVPKEKIIGRTDSFVSRDWRSFRNKDRAAATGVSTMNEEWLTFADNQYCGLFETIKTPMRDKNGALIGILGTAAILPSAGGSKLCVKIRRSWISIACIWALVAAEQRSGGEMRRFRNPVLNGSDRNGDSLG
jgi:hypothetical protein